jgi:DNA-directed RNA polymerase beta subunit
MEGLKSKTYVATKKGRIYLRHNSIHEDIPIVIALKALGIQSDKEILLLTASNNESYKTVFSANIEDAAKLGVFTRQQALEYIGTRVKVNRRVMGPRRPAWEEALEALATIVLAHVPVNGLNFRSKAIFVATMTRRVLMAIDDEKMVDDRDYVGNKRLELYVSLDLNTQRLWTLIFFQRRSITCTYSSRTCSKPTIPTSRSQSIRFSKNLRVQVNLMPTIRCECKEITLLPALCEPSLQGIGP